ncbi:MAG: nitroreductase family protein [Deltaproteobacteria bacterium]|nr:nitroreductase family protein [Deltaproteobacteria bacterium]
MEEKEKRKVFYELYERRKSVREFADGTIEPDKLSRLLVTLNRAQSAANRQPWHFIVAEKKGREELDSLLHKEGFRNAPVIIAACAEPAQAWIRKADKVNYAWVDVTIAVTEMIGAATAEGLGTCWIASLEPDRVKSALGIPAHIDIVALIAVGYPTTELLKENKSRKSLGEIIHYGKW